jgi:N-acyl-D-amino-acid deacylase
MPPRSRLQLLRCCLLLLITLSLHHAAQADEPNPPSPSDAPAISPPAVQRSLHAASAADTEKFLQELAASGLIVSQLQTRLQRGTQVFDIEAVKNTSESAWMVHINLSTADFKTKSTTYDRDGYQLVIQQGLYTGAKRRWLGVWVQQQQSPAQLQIPTGEIPVTGSLGQHLEPLSLLVTELLRKEQIPGATLAVLDGDRLVFERGFGYADLDTQLPMQPDAVMRIASISKPLTAAAILSLASSGRLSLDDTLFHWLNQHHENWDLAAARDVDPRWSEICIRHLLQHTAGFDRERSRDTMFELVRIAAALNLKRRLQTPDIVRYQLTQPLDFQPGSEYAYSNVGYCLLGRVIEAVTQQSYEQAMQELVLNPCSMQHTKLGRTQLQHQLPDEVRYHTRSRQKVPLVLDVLRAETRRDPELVEQPYGQWDLEVMDAHGGWTSTAADLMRFIKGAMTESNRKQVARPVPGLTPEPSSNDAWYGAGWQLRKSSNGRGLNFWHTGRLAGTSTLLVRRYDNRAWAILFNTDTGLSGKTCADLIDPLLHPSITSATTLPPSP